MLYTTLELCKKNYACADGYRKLKKSLPDAKMTDSIPLTHIIESNSMGDAIWALRATTEPCLDLITEFAVWCVEQVLDIYEKEYPDDKRVRECLEGVRKYQKGEISKEDLAALRRAAYADAAAADAAAYTAYATAYAAAAAADAVDAAYAAADTAAAAAAADAADDVDAADAAFAARQAQKEKFIEMLNENKGE